MCCLSFDIVTNIRMYLFVKFDIPFKTPPNNKALKLNDKLVLPGKHVKHSQLLDISKHVFYFYMSCKV